MPKKNDSLGATVSTESPALTAAARYCRPSAIVRPNSSIESAPASWMWYPDTLMIYMINRV
jgi:hypothetical protein